MPSVRLRRRHPVRSRLGPAGPWAIGAVGSALPSHGRGHQFESGIAHHDARRVSSRHPSRSACAARRRRARIARDPERMPRAACPRRARCRAARCRSTTAGPGCPTDPGRSQEVAVAVVRLAREPDGVDAIGVLAADDEHRTILAASVVLGVRHPGPDDLPRIRVAVVGGSVGDAESVAGAAARSRSSRSCPTGRPPGARRAAPRAPERRFGMPGGRAC